MLVLGGICGIIALFVCMTDTMSRTVKNLSPQSSGNRLTL